jgi:ATP-dependent Clp protease ATP-binding subunit ClpA
LELASLAEDFAELTDGFQTLELEALRHTSHREKLLLSQKELIKLVDFYKFGQKEEPFEQINAEKISQAREQLTRSVLGQNHAIEAVTNMGVADLQYESLKMQLLKHWLRLVSRCMQNSISYPD